MVQHRRELIPTFLIVFHATAVVAQAPVPSLEARDPAFHELIDAGTEIEVLADGFDWTEGPVWRKQGGYLLFSDVPQNTMYRWHPEEGLSVFLRPSGLAAGTPPGRELGSNGLVEDAQGRLVMADHGNRQLARLDEATFTKETLAARHMGKRLNSPNDVVLRPGTGDLYFTDPPYGLERHGEDPAKELPYNAVYRLTPAGELAVATTELAFPNGLMFAPDGRTLYVSSTEAGRPVILAFAVNDDGTLGAWRTFFDASELLRGGRTGGLDGMAVDAHGNLFATGPGGVLVLTPDGHHIGTILTGVATGNVTFGDDGSSLYITADAMLLRVRTRTHGAGF